MSKCIFCWLIFLFLAGNLHALSIEEQELIDEVKKAYRNYMLEDYLKMSEAEIKTKENNQKIYTEKAIYAALNAKNYDEPDSLLAHLLRDSDISFQMFQYIILNKKKIASSKYKAITRWYISSITANEHLANAVIKTAIINFTHQDFDDKTLEFMKNTILNNETVNICGIMFWDNLSDDVIAELKKTASDLNNKSYSKIRSWFALCILARNDENYITQVIESASSTLKKEKSPGIWIDTILGLAFTENRKAVDLLLDLLDSKQASRKNHDTEPSQIQIAHEAASALYILVENFPECRSYEEFTQERRKLFQDWRTKYRENYTIKSHNLLFYLKNTRIGLF